MLSIRFSRTGKKKQPYFRLLVTEKQKDPWGKYIELLGHYNPRTKLAQFKEERIKYWLGVGAQATVSVHNLLIKLGIVQGKKKNPIKISIERKNKIHKAKEEEEKAKAESRAQAEAAKTEAKTKTEAPAEQVKAKSEEPQPAAEKPATASQPTAAEEPADAAKPEAAS